MARFTNILVLSSDDDKYQSLRVAFSYVFCAVSFFVFVSYTISTILYASQESNEFMECLVIELVILQVLFQFSFVFKDPYKLVRIVNGIKRKFSTIDLDIVESCKKAEIGWYWLFTAIVFLDLDLDYLEDPTLFELSRSQESRDRVPDGAESEEEEGEGEGDGSDTCTDSMDLDDFIKIILLGAQGVGKTSIIQQFVWTSYDKEYLPTQRKHTYYPTIIRNETYYGLKITDLPCIPYFPIDSYMEWTDFRFYGLRQATAYILVFDLSKNHIDSTFQYIKSLRDQILESRAKDIEKVTLMVVGNKLDLMPNLDRLHVAPKQSHSLLDTVAQTLNGSHHRPLTPYETARKNIITLVRKHWRCPYVECSAKYNYKLNHAFKELMDTIEANYRRAQMSREKQARPRRHGLLTAFQHRMNRSNEEENVEEGEGSSRNCRIL